MTRRTLALLLLAILAGAGPANAGDGGAAALEKVYEAADAIDAARSEAQAGRPDEARRLLDGAERLLGDARRLDPALARVGYEQARIHLLREDAPAARAALVASMRLDLELSEHVRMAELLDEVRRDLGRPPLGTEWRTSTTVRDAGLGALGGGLGLAAAGLAIAYVSFEQAAREGPSAGTLGANRLGWALAGIGGGIGIAGGAVTVVGQVRLEGLRRILPGPWRLAAGSAQEAPTVVVAVRLRW